MIGAALHYKIGTNSQNSLQKGRKHLYSDALEAYCNIHMASNVLVDTVRLQNYLFQLVNLVLKEESLLKFQEYASSVE